MSNDSMENKMNEAIDALYTMCLGAQGVAPEQRASAREAIDSVRMYFAYQTFDTEATRRENNGLRAMLKDKRNPRRGK